MQFALIVLALQIAISVAQGPDYYYYYYQGQGRFDIGSIETRQSLTSTSTLIPAVFSPEFLIEEIVAAISLGDVDGISDAIKGVDSVDVGSAFVIATESDANLQNLGLFVLAVVSNVPADVQTVSATVDAFKIMAEKQQCEQIFLVFSVIEELVGNDEILTENLLLAFSDASNVLECATNTPAPISAPTPRSAPAPAPAALISSPPPLSVPAPAFVPVQNVCYEGSQPCSWWEKKYRSLLNEYSQCEQRYVCIYFGYDTIAQCNNTC